MQPRIHILSGSLARRVMTFQREPIHVGRDADAELRFGPAADLAVSARHAIIGRDERGWYLRDLGSRNGTFVNGRRVAPSTYLADRDRIEFGAGGPAVEFRTSGGAIETQPVRWPDAHGPATAATAASAETATAERGAPGVAPVTGASRLEAEGDAGPAAAGLTGRIRVQVAAQTARLRRRAFALAVLAAAGAVLVAGLAFVLHRQRSGWEAERAELTQRVDSLLAATEDAVGALHGEMRELAEALERSRAEVHGLRDAVRDAESRADTAETNVLRRRLQSATTALARHQIAAALDFRGIGDRNTPAVAMIYAESGAGEVRTGTAFAVRSDAVLVTSRHVVVDGTGRPSRRLAVQFAGSDQVWPARLLAASGDADLALLRADNIIGDVPTIQGLNLRPDTLRGGTPVAVIGFPLSDAEPTRPSRALPRPLVSAGVLLASSPDIVELQGYGAEGASGSPIFDANGELVAVLFGGRTEAGERTLLAVPASLVVPLLDAVR